jgi:hypothetical protein
VPSDSEQKTRETVQEKSVYGDTRQTYKNNLHDEITGINVC